MEFRSDSNDTIPNMSNGITQLLRYSGVHLNF